MARECPNGHCVIGKTEQFLDVLRDAKADRAARAEALKYVVHFVGDLHQPLHDEDNGDRGGNGRQITFEGHPDNLHWVWDTGLLSHVTKRRGARCEPGEPDYATRPDGVDQGEHRGLGDGGLAQTVANEDLGDDRPAVIGPAYQRHADPVIELQLEKAGPRLAYLLHAALEAKLTWRTSGAPLAQFHGFAQVPLANLTS